MPAEKFLFWGRRIRICVPNQTIWIFMAGALFKRLPARFPKCAKGFPYKPSAHRLLALRRARSSSYLSSGPAFPDLSCFSALFFLFVALCMAKPIGAANAVPITTPALAPGYFNVVCLNLLKKTFGIIFSFSFLFSALASVQHNLKQALFGRF